MLNIMRKRVAGLLVSTALLSSMLSGAEELDLPESPPPVEAVLSEKPCRTIELDGVSLPPELLDHKCIQITPDFRGDLADTINRLEGKKVVILQGREPGLSEAVITEEDTVTYTLNKVLMPKSGVSVIGGLSKRRVILQSSQSKMIEPVAAGTGKPVDKSFIQNLTFNWNAQFFWNACLFHSPCGRVNLTIADNSFNPRKNDGSVFYLWCQGIYSVQAESDHPVITFIDNTVTGLQDSVTYTDKSGNLKNYDYTTSYGFVLVLGNSLNYTGKLKIIGNHFQGPMENAVWVVLRETSSADLYRNYVGSNQAGKPKVGFFLDFIGVIGHEQPTTYNLSGNNISASNTGIFLYPYTRLCMASNTIKAEHMWGDHGGGVTVASDLEVAQWCGDTVMAGREDVVDTRNNWLGKNSPCDRLRLKQGQIVFDQEVCSAGSTTPTVASMNVLPSIVPDTSPDIDPVSDRIPDTTPGATGGAVSLFMFTAIQLSLIVLATMAIAGF